MKKIFLLSAPARSGKDTVADIMMGKLDGKSIKIAMADYLKFMAKTYYGWDGEKNLRGRSLLQQLGTDKIRDEMGWQTFHVERVCQDIEVIKDDYDYIFIPDVRFKDEMYYTMAKFPENTTTIRVERLDFENNLTLKQKKHRSETGLSDFVHDHNLFCREGLDKVEEEIDSVLGDLIYELNDIY